MTAKAEKPKETEMVCSECGAIDESGTAYCAKHRRTVHHLREKDQVQQILDEFARWKKEMINETSEYFCEICGGTHRDYSKKRKDKETTENDLVKRLATLAFKRGEERGKECRTKSCGWNQGGVCKCPKT